MYIYLYIYICIQGGGEQVERRFQGTLLLCPGAYIYVYIQIRIYVYIHICVCIFIYICTYLCMVQENKFNVDFKGPFSCVQVHIFVYIYTNV